MIPKPSGVPSAVDFAPLFSDNTTLYFYDPTETASDTVWTYNVSTSSWKNIPVASASANAPAPSTGGWVSNAVGGKSFYLGTPESALSRRDIASPGLQVLDTSTTPPQWTSGTAGGPLLSAAGMVYVRSGEAGVLVAFGGVDPNDHSEFSSSTLGAYRDMDKIFIYDIASSTWFNVTATGDVPVGRINFCAGVSAAPDDSSFQILIYGGFNLLYGNPANDMFVLSIPSFQWIKVTPKNADPFGRWEHTCVVWEEAQMIVLGGLMKLSTAGPGPAVNADGCNSSHPPLAVIDTTSFTFQSQFEPQRSYSVPQAVYQVIGGDYRGLSSMKGPKDGFGDSKLDAIFSKTVPRITQPTSFPPVPSATASSAANVNINSSTTSSSSGLSTAAIAGIAAGGGVALILIIAAVVACLVVRKKRRKRAQAAELNNYSGKPELPSPGWPGLGKPKDMQDLTRPNGPVMVHEVDSGDRVHNEADPGARIIELNGHDPFEVQGRQLSAEEAEAYLRSRENRNEGRRRG